MNLTDMITELGYDLDRSDINDRIKKWIQQSVNFASMSLTSMRAERTELLFTVAGEETLLLEDDVGSIEALLYTPGTGHGYAMKEVTASSFFKNHADQSSEGLPEEYCIYDQRIFLSPVPDSVYSMTLRYRRFAPDIYTHTLNLIDDDSAATNGVAVYVDEDAISYDQGKLYFASPATADGYINLATTNSHKHNVDMTHLATAATLGVQVYFDETETIAENKFLFVSPENQDTFITSGVAGGHRHVLKIKHDPAAATNGEALYFDEDASNPALRFLYVSPTNASSTLTTAVSRTGEIPNMPPEADELVYLGAFYRGLSFLKRYDDASVAKKELGVVLAAANNQAVIRQPKVAESRKYGHSSRENHNWLSHQEIDD